MKVDGKKFLYIKNEKPALGLANPSETEICLAFSVGLQAASTNIHPHFTAVILKAYTLNIRLKLPFRLPFRKAAIVTRHRLLATNFTFSHNFTSPGQSKSDHERSLRFIMNEQRL